MQPTLQEKDCVLVWKFHYTLQPGDIIITNKDNVLSQNLVKRVIAAEGQTVRFEKDSVWVDGVKLEEEYIAQDETVEYEEKEFVVSKGEVFLMGDNRNHSKDSREVGCFSKESIAGKVVCKIGT